jgi:hypothetical protein
VSLAATEYRWRVLRIAAQTATPTAARAPRAEVTVATLFASSQVTEIEHDLPTHSNLLWDCERAPKPAEAPRGTRRPLAWRPKLEGTLAAYLAHELTIRLASRGDQSRGRRQAHRRGRLR